MSGSAYLPRLGSPQIDDLGRSYDASIRDRVEATAGPGVDRAAIEAHLAVLTCTRHVTEALEPLAAAGGISLSRVAVLMKLWKVPDGSAPMHELASWCNVSARNVTGLVDGLEADGLVERSVDAADRRITRVRLTDEGRRRIEMYAPRHWAKIAAIYAGISDDERRTLIDICVRLAEAARSLDDAV